eukprot:TRINITY_DN11671_c0_g1_i1.p1 TRINITY_DN11671_c0_g1~~TRINITY_DN11671_c0_g1_i1.p1  ORF type:complete len:219 (-),score=63.81 TRINITY_DN11671_c0_g1_i1:442-1098(-)
MSGQPTFPPFSAWPLPTAGSQLDALAPPLPQQPPLNGLDPQQLQQAALQQYWAQYYQYYAYWMFQQQQQQQLAALQQGQPSQAPQPPPSPLSQLQLPLQQQPVPQQQQQQQQPPPQQNNGNIPGPNRKGLYSLFVYHLPNNITEQKMREIFGQYGEVVEVVIMREDMNDQTSRPKGFGFVNYRSYNEAHAAVDNLNGFRIENKRLQVSFKKDKDQQMA